jgi:hypothetical protein
MREVEVELEWLPAEPVGQHFRVLSLTDDEGELGQRVDKERLYASLEELRASLALLLGDEVMVIEANSVR